MQYRSLQHRSYLQSHPQLDVVFALAQSLHSFWSYFSSSMLCTYRPGEFIFQCHIFVISFRVMPFHTVHGVIKATILKWVAIPFSSGHVLSELSTLTHQSLVALHSMAHSFIELDKAVVHVISLISFL